MTRAPGITARSRDAIIARLRTQMPDAIARETGLAVSTIEKLSRLHNLGPGRGRCGRPSTRNHKRT